MPFRYTPNQNRYVGSIADLMGRGNDAEAQALIASANAQARAAQASGQAWGGAVQGIGNTIAAIPGQMQAQQDRDRVMEERERADQSRAMKADIFNTAPGHTIGPTIADGTPLNPPPPGPMDGMPGFGRAEINPPGMSGFGTASIVDGPGAASEAMNPAAGDVQGGDVAEGLELPNRYRTTDANGSDIFDLEQIIAAFASAGLDAPDMSPYLAINQEISGRFDQSLANARGVARTLLEGPAGAWEQGLRTSLGVYEANGLLPAPMLASMRTQLEDIASLPQEEKEARLGQLLHQLTGDAAPDPVIARPGSMLVESDYPGATRKITTLGEEELTAQEQALEAYANRLYPDHEGPNARSLLTDEDILAYNTRQANLRDNSGGGLYWTDTGAFTRDKNGDFVPALGPEGNQLQPRDTSAVISSLSPSMSPDYKSAIGRAILNSPGTRRESLVDEFNRAWESAESTGDRSGLNDLIRYAAIETENVANKERIVGRMATVNSLRDVRETLRRYSRKGPDGKTVELPTGWLFGVMENLHRKVGMSTDVRYVELANRLMGTLINYRRAATGVQFGQLESDQYKSMFPNYGNLAEVNESLINGLLDEMDSYDSTYWVHKLGAEGAALIGMVDRPGVIPEVLSWAEIEAQEAQEAQDAKYLSDAAEMGR
jgi:hypothetical protein